MRRFVFVGLTRVALPATLLFAGLVSVNVLSLVYLLAFLGFVYMERYGVDAVFPIRGTVLLVLYSACDLVAQATGAALIAQEILDADDRSDLLDALGIARFDRNAWGGLRCITGPFIVFTVGFLSMGYFSTQGLFRFDIFIRPVRYAFRRIRATVTGHRTAQSVAASMAQESRPSLSSIARPHKRNTRTARHDPASALQDFQSQEDSHLTAPSRTSDPLARSGHIPSRFFFFLALRGGSSWVVLSLAVAGMAYSSLITLVFIATSVAAILGWSLDIPSWRPRKRPRQVVRVVNAVRILLALQILLVYVANIPHTRILGSPVAQFIGAVALEGEIRPWAACMGLGASLFCFLISGFYEAALRAIFVDFEKFVVKDRDPLRGQRFSVLGFLMTKASCHLGAIGFLVWAMVFPGILTAPLLAYAVFVFIAASRNPRRLHRFAAYYAVGLHSIYFMYGALSTLSSTIAEAGIPQLLGLRQLNPSFGGNSIQFMAMVTLAIGNFSERRLSGASVSTGETSVEVTPGQSLWGVVLQFPKSMFFRRMMSPLRLFIDQVSLIAVFLVGGYLVSIVNTVFLLILVLLALAEGIVSNLGNVFVTRRTVTWILWRLTLYLTVFYTIAVPFFCRMENGVPCNLVTAGFFRISDLAVVFASGCLVLASVQVHFNWDGALTVVMPDLSLYESRFWLWLRTNFRFLTYVVVTVVPLCFPANFLSYGYIAFLAACLFVEIIVSTIRIGFLLPRLFNTGNIFVVATTLARYFPRFPQVRAVMSNFATTFIFGYERGVDPFLVNLGDGILLVVLSLQGYLFTIDNYVGRQMEETPRGAASGGFVPESATQRELQFVQEVILKPVQRTHKILVRLWGVVRKQLRRILFNYSYAGTALAILVSSIWLNGVSVFGLAYLFVGVVGVVSDGRVRLTMDSNGRKDVVYPQAMRFLPPLLLTISFGFLTVQFLYMILVLSGTDWGEIAFYIGLRASTDLTQIPWSNSSVVGHIVVLLAAFLERATLKWAASDRDSTIDDVTVVSSRHPSRDGSADDQDIPKVTVSNPVEIELDETEEGVYIRDRRFAESLKEVVSRVDGTVTDSMTSGDVDRHVTGLHEMTEEPVQKAKSDVGGDPGLVLDLDDLQSSSQEDTSSRVSVRNESAVLDAQQSARPLSGLSEWRENRDGNILDLFRIPLRLLKDATKVILSVVALVFPYWRSLGFETTFFVILAGAFITSSIFTTAYLLMVGLVYLLPAARMKRIWVLWTLVLGTICTIQYILALGLPPSAHPDIDLRSDLLTYLYLDSNNQSHWRKWNLTIGYLAVICAGITLNNLPSDDAFDLVSRMLGFVPKLLYGGATESNSEGSTELDSQDEAVDFTRSPLSIKDMIVLWSMRFSSGFVQLFVLIVASVNTTIFTLVLLLMSFVFFLQFVNIPAKKLSFQALRVYLMVVLVALIIYKIPGMPSLEQRWEKGIGLYRFKSEDDTSAALEGTLVCLWLLTQLQGRMFESRRFKFVVQYIEAEESFRFRRAIHGHQSLLFERMLKQNKIARDTAARQRRLGRIKELIEMKTPLEKALWEACVKDTKQLLEDEVSAEDYLLDRLDYRKAKVADLQWWNRLVRFIFRGSAWVLHSNTSLFQEFQYFLARHSAWAVYISMVISAIVSPSVFTLVNVMILFLYLVQEQPRPPPSVWKLLIGYNMLVTLVKFVLRWPVLRYCEPAGIPYFEYPFERSDPSHPGVTNFSPCALGAGIFYNILILLTLFWHRIFLYYRGLWDLKTSEEDLRVHSQIVGRPVQSPTPDAEIREKWIMSADQQIRVCDHLLFASEEEEATRQSDPGHRKTRSMDSEILLAWTENEELRGDLRFRGTHRRTSQTNKSFAAKGSEPTRGAADDEIPRNSVMSRFVRRSQYQNQGRRDDASGSDSEIEDDDKDDSLGEIQRRTNFLIEPLANHFKRLLREIPYEAVGDYYLWMFVADFACFLYMIFGWPFMFTDPNALGQTYTWWNSNFISLRHLGTLLLLYLGIVTDRILYFRRHLLGKIILQYVSVVLYHWVLFIHQNIGTRVSVKVFYALKCVYFFISGLQIRSGFPKYTVGQRLMRNFTMIGFFIFLGYYSIPFLWLSRSVLDWAFMKTSLELVQYFKLQDIYVRLYMNRAVNAFRSRFRRIRGEGRPLLIRSVQGFGVFLLFSILMFSPFLLFSALNPFFVSRRIESSQFQVSLVIGENIFPMFERVSTEDGQATAAQVAEFRTEYALNSTASPQSSSYIAQYRGNSARNFDISFPDSQELSILLLSNNASLIQHLSAVDKLERYTARITIEMTELERVALAEALQSGSRLSMMLANSLPRLLELSSTDNTFQAVDNGDRTLCLSLNTAGVPSTPVRWWSLNDCLMRDNCDCEAPQVDTGRGTSYLLSIANVSSLTFGGGTIIALYAVILFTVASFAKNMFANKRLEIPYSDAPYTLHLYQIVYDILHSRQDGDTETEEILFWGLTEIYRDPHKLARWGGFRQVIPNQRWWTENQVSWPAYVETETETYIRRKLE